MVHKILVEVKQMKKLSHEANYILQLVISVFVVLTLFYSIFIMFELEENIENDAMRIAQKDSLIISERINTYFSDGIAILNQMLTSQILEEYLTDTNTIDDVYNFYRMDEVLVTLDEINNSHEDLLNVWIGVRGIENLLTQDADFDEYDGFVMENRPWYIKMNKNKGVVSFSDVYVDWATKLEVISVTSPFYEDSKLSGAYGIDLSLARVSEFVQSYKIGETGSALLIDGDKNIVVSSSTMIHEDIVNKFFETKAMLDLNAFDETVEFDGVKYFINVAKLSVNDWLVITVLPETEVFHNNSLLSILDASIYVIGFFIVFLLFILRRVDISNNELRKSHAVIMENKEVLNKQHDEIVTYNTMLLDSREQIKQLAEQDPLTNIPNRRMFYSYVEEQLDKGKVGIVVMIDLDNFKNLNDVLGHVYGDEVLKLVANSLVSLSDDTTLVSRFGGDEFLVCSICDEAKTKEDILNCKKELIIKIEQTVNKIYKKDNDELYINGSIGVTTFPFDGEELDDLVKNADVAMYKAKDSELSKVVIFNKVMESALVSRTKIEKKIRDALDLAEFDLVYQPLVMMDSGEIIGFEALLRLKDRSFTPDEMIPVAEATGLIVDVGRWVVKEAINTLVHWKKMGHDLKTISINMSVRQLTDDEFPTFVEQLLNEHDIEGKYLEIEVTESVFLSNRTNVIEFFERVIRLGIKISLDDFGTGYASLSYLDYIPLSKMKLDKYLVDKDCTEEVDSNFVKSIIRLAHDFDLKVVAEGVEHETQYHILEDFDCDIIQGYLFSKPLVLSEVDKIYNLVLPRPKKINQ